MITLLSHYDIIVLCHIITLYHINISLSLSLYQYIKLYDIIYHYIILSLCALPLSVTMTIIHTTDTGWLPQHDTTTGHDSGST